LQRDILALRQQWQADLVLIEKDGIGTAIVQHLQEAKVEGVRYVKPKYDKRIRLSYCLGMIERGDVLLPQKASWLPALALEMLSFPNGEHDDQIDSMTQFLRYASSLDLSHREKAPPSAPRAADAPETYESPGRARAYARSRREESNGRIPARHYDGRDALIALALRRIR
jgi:predicted phage terminase large subunit-like protein